MNSNNNISLSFKSLIIKPHSYQWDKKVLNAALDSKFVNDVIKNDAKLGRDTIMQYEKNTINFSDKPTYKNSSFLLNPQREDKVVLFSSKPIDARLKSLQKQDLDTDKHLANQIKLLDKPSIDKSLVEKLSDVKKIAGNIVYEDGNNFLHKKVEKSNKDSILKDLRI